MKYKLQYFYILKGSFSRSCVDNAYNISNIPFLSIVILCVGGYLIMSDKRAEGTILNKPKTDNLGPEAVKATTLTEGFIVCRSGCDCPNSEAMAGITGGVIIII